MPLRKEIEALIAEYPADAQAEVRAYYEKYPAVQDKVANEQMKAQSDYSRAIQEAKKQEKAATDLHKKNMDWFKDSEADFTRLEAANKQLEADLAAAKSAQKAAPPDGSVDYGPMIADMKARLDASDKALKDAQTETAIRFDRGGLWILEVEQAAEKYRSEFGKPLDRAAFTKWMNENGQADPSKALAVFSAEDVRVKWEKDKEVEITARLKAEQSANGRMPYDNGATMLEKGPLQRFINPTEAEKIPAGITADGSGRLGSLAAAELRQEGKT